MGLERYWLARFDYTAQLEDAVTELVWELESLGSQETEGKSCGKALLAYFPGSLDPKTLLRTLEERLARIAAPSEAEVSLVPCTFDSDAWLKSYAKSFRGFEIDQEIFIYPPWDRPSTAHQVNIRLEPGHGFGTGTHESTQLAIQALKAPVQESRSLIDVGTGSGILSIVAQQLNPNLRVIAFDVDPLAVEAAAENFRRNDLAPCLLYVGESSLLREGADLLVANLTSSLLLALASELNRLTRRNLIVSGFTTDESARVEDCFIRKPGGFKVSGRYEKRGWSSYHLKRCADS